MKGGPISIRGGLVALGLVGVLGLGCAPPSDSTSGLAEVGYTLPDGSDFTGTDLIGFESSAEEAGEAYGDGDYARCVEAFDAALALYDANGDLWFNRACCLALDGRTDDALESLRRAIDLDAASAESLQQDQDLAALRGSAAFAQLIERAEVRDQQAAQRDPMAGPADPGGPWADLDAIQAAFAVMPRDPLVMVVGKAKTRRREERFRRDHVAALRAYLADHPDDVAARYAELEALLAFDPPTSQAAEAFERFVADHGDGPWAGVVTLRRAVEPYDDDVFSDPGHPDHEAAFAAVVAAARAIVDEAPDGPASRDAWYWLLRDALRRQDRDAVRPAFEALDAHWGDDARFWRDRKQVLAVARIIANGVPEFEAETIDGETVTPQALVGRVVLLDFWATWCGPCIEQLPHLRALYAEHGAAGFEILGISADHRDRIDEAAFRQWLVDERMTWMQIYTGEGWDQDLYRAFGVVGIPTTILLDREGEIVGVDLDGEALDDAVASLL